MKCLIVAVADDGAIGLNGMLPWHISEDLKYFKSKTLGCPVIMGRATFESLGRPLPGRLNIVLSHGDLSLDGAVSAHSLEEAFTLAAGAERCFVIGGSKVYAQSLDMVDRIYITYVHTTIPAADAFFPVINPSIWQEVSRSELRTDPESGLEFEFVEYARK